MRNIVVFLILLTHSFISKAGEDFTLKTYENLCEIQGMPMSKSSTKDICEIVVKSEICSKVTENELIKCDSVDSYSMTDYWDYTLGCTNGAFNFIGDTLGFFWEVMKWAWGNTVSSETRSESIAGANEYMNSSKLFLITEYQKAHTNATPPFQEAQALKQMGQAIGKMLYDSISSQLAKEQEELGCLNGWTRNARICQVYSEIFLPPTAVLAFLKKGPQAVKEFPQLKALVAKVEPLNFSDLLQKYPALGRTYAAIGVDMPGSKLISDPSEIPFDLSGEFRPIDAEKMKLRAGELEPEIKSSITAAYNSLNDPKHLKTYYQTLFEDAAEWVAKKGKTDDLKLLAEGKISLHAVAVVVVKRLKERGDNNFTTIINGKLKTGKIEVNPEDIARDNDMFRTAIKSGPFFDRAFNNTNRYGHGSFAHLVQRDIVHAAVSKDTGGNPQKFYDFLGSKKGVNWWADLFDSGNVNSMTRPEVVTEYIFHKLTPNDD